MFCYWLPTQVGFLTSCEVELELVTGGPEEGEWKYCPYCGELLRVAKLIEEEGEPN